MMYFAPATEPRCGGRAAGCTSVPFYVPNGLCSFSTQPSPPARRRGSLHVKFRVILSYRRLITRRLGNLVTLPCYCLLVITATPLRRLRYAVTRAPLSRSLRDGSGRLGTGPGRTRQSKPLYIHARTNWLVRQWALLHGPARAGPRWVSGGQELDRGKAIAHRSVLKRRLR